MKEWNEDPAAAEAKYGHIKRWDVGEVESFYELFEDMKDFNEDLSLWNVGNAKTFDRMVSGGAGG